jgi:anti-anti-sigma factor
VDIDTAVLENFTLITIKGRIVIGRDVDSAKKELLKIIESVEKNVILDLKNVTFIDSSGLGALASLKTAADLKGTKIALVGLSSQLKRMLEITGLSEIFETYSTTEEAAYELNQKCI